MFIPDVYFSHPGSRIRIKEFKYFNPKKLFLSSWKYDTGCSSRIRILILLPIRDPGSRGQNGTGSRIWIHSTGVMKGCICCILPGQHLYMDLTKRYYYKSCLMLCQAPIGHVMYIYLSETKYFESCPVQRPIAKM